MSEPGLNQLVRKLFSNNNLDLVFRSVFFFFRTEFVERHWAHFLDKNKDPHIKQEIHCS